MGLNERDTIRYCAKKDSLNIQKNVYLWRNNQFWSFYQMLLMIQWNLTVIIFMFWWKFNLYMSLLSNTHPTLPHIPYLQFTYIFYQITMSTIKFLIKCYSAPLLISRLAGYWMTHRQLLVGTHFRWHGIQVTFMPSLHGRGYAITWVCLSVCPSTSHWDCFLRKQILIDNRTGMWVISKLRSLIQIG